MNISPFASPVYVMLKPVGSVCNLACDYCYYLEKSKLYPNTKNQILTDELLETFIQQYIDLYRESEQVNDISPRASATLSRYLLQMLFHEELRISKRNLEEELKELEEVPNVPSELVTMLQVMRRVSNFGAHPNIWLFR